VLWCHNKNKNVFLATAGIYCMISPPLSRVMEDCSIVRAQQLQVIYRQRCCMSVSQRNFGSLWNVVVAHEHRRQDRIGTMAKCQTATDERASQPCNLEVDVLAYRQSVADAALALCGLNERRVPVTRWVAALWTRLQLVHQSSTAEEQ